ncbi:hypothetical protein [Streptomyces fructofermentans]|uniref:hypothetical protein n=1 Tax=Streptomyces fructofermentans TaxID=152141 RepID=UPI0033EBC59B
MYLARGASDADGAWLWALGAILLYALISFGLDYRSRARRGSRHPARDALHDLKDREEPQSPREHFVSRLIMLAGGGATGLVAYTTSGVPRIVAVTSTAIVAVTVWAYYDHRTDTAASRGR